MKYKPCCKCSHHHVCHTTKSDDFNYHTENCWFRRYNAVQRSPKYNLVIIINHPAEYMPEENQTEPGFRELHMTKSSPCNFCHHAGFTCYGNGQFNKCTGFAPWPKEYGVEYEHVMSTSEDDLPF